MSRLTKDQIINIAKEKELVIVNPDSYISLSSDLQFKCLKCNGIFISNINTVRSKNFMCPKCEIQHVIYNKVPPEKKAGVYRIIGFDQATKNFGISIFDDGQLVYYDVVSFIGTMEDRLGHIAKFVEKVCREWKPDYVQFEDIQLQNKYAGFKTFKVLAELLGVVTSVLINEKVPHGIVLNKVWQSTFMINGKDRRTQKSNVIKKVKGLFGIDVNDDIADAVLIGFYAVHRKKAVNKINAF